MKTSYPAPFGTLGPASSPSTRSVGQVDRGRPPSECPPGLSCSDFDGSGVWPARHVGPTGSAGES